MKEGVKGLGIFYALHREQLNLFLLEEAEVDAANGRRHRLGYIHFDRIQHRRSRTAEVAPVAMELCSS